MKVAIGHIVQHGPFGGGNRFVVSLARALEAAGHEVCFDLKSNDIDLILMTDPRSRSPNVSFAGGAILRYLARRNPNAIVVHRINECDERKDTNWMNWRLRTANYAADATVFIASWLRDLDVWRDESQPEVILNGADTRIFHTGGRQPWDGKEPLRFVTHHWGGNRMKGFDVYEHLDALMAQPEWRGKLDFSYIGNLPDGVAFRNATHYAPMDGAALGAELRKHHAYVTASVNEPAGMHHIEGALSGLPLLYRRSGALPEYCADFGVAFEPDTFEAALREFYDRFFEYAARLPAYDNTADKMCAQYIALFEGLVARKAEICAQRRLLRNPFAFFINQLPV
jgi:hypothetical protein